jgi:hypothetical protein
MTTREGRRGRTRLVGLTTLLLLALTACGSDIGPLSSSAVDVSVSPSAETTTGPEVVALEPRPLRVPDDPAQRRALRMLSNGCHYSERGIPSCGVLMGAAYGGNREPSAWEDSMGHGLGVRRTYWAPDEVDEAVASAAHDLSRQRVPWMSFKLPHSWEDMREGSGDAWARSLARDLAGLDGPVWLALHHEPEGDGDIRAWTAMQARLAPIVREAAPNVAYSIILTGWQQLNGEREYSLDALWPEGTSIDLLGFDVFNKYGVQKDGTTFDEHTRLRRDYFPSFDVFAKQHGVAWGLAETGYTDEAAREDPDWISRTYDALLENDGVVFSYFNSRLNSAGSWYLTGEKERRFAEQLRSTPTL